MATSGRGTDGRPEGNSRSHDAPGRPSPAPYEAAAGGLRRPEPPLEHGRRVGAAVNRLTLLTGGGAERARLYGRAALFHDVGKAALPEQLLVRSGTLSPGEYELVKLHPVFGEKILSRWTSGAADLARCVARSHHERWDGSGYPDGRRGGEIPYPARVTAVADALDAMLRGRPYAAAVDPDDALAELRSEAGRQFDPRVVEALLDRPDPVVRACLGEE